MPIIIFTILLSLAFSPNFTFAFFSPSTFQLLVASISSPIVQIIAVLTVTVGSFAIKIKKKQFRRVLFVSLFSCLFIFLIIINFRFHTLKKLNQLPILNENSFAEIYSHNKDLLKNRYIDLNKITKSEYKTFKKINLLPNRPLELTDTTFSINFIELKQLISDNKIDEFFNCLLYTSPSPRDS
mgnify:CR=1 FL=1